MVKMSKIRVRTLATGTKLEIPVYFFKGKNAAAPKTYIQSSMHGAEVQGNAVIAALIAHLEKSPPLGDITLVPLANPDAIHLKIGEYTHGRFDPTTGANWNRNYWQGAMDSGVRDPLQVDCAQFAAENLRLAWPQMAKKFSARLRSGLDKKMREPNPFGAKLAFLLQKMAFAADIVLDLHCANRSVRHLYAPEYAVRDAKFFQIPFHLLIPNEFSGALDESCFHPWWTLWNALQDEKYAGLPDPNEIPRAFTLELGNHEEVSRADAETDAAGILNYLKSRGAIAGKPQKPKAVWQCELANYRTIYCENPGLVDFSAPLGKPCPKGQPLAHTLQFLPGPAWRAELAQEDCIPILRHSSAVIHEGSELCKVFTKFRRS